MPCHPSASLTSVESLPVRSRIELTREPLVRRPVRSTAGDREILVGPNPKQQQASWTRPRWILMTSPLLILIMAANAMQVGRS